MKKRKKSQKRYFRDFAPAITLAGGALGASVVGEALGPHLPAGSTNPLTTTSTAMTSFVGPAVAIGAMSVTMRQLKKFKPKSKYKKKRG